MRWFLVGLFLGTALAEARRLERAPAPVLKLVPQKAEA